MTFGPSAGANLRRGMCCRGLRIRVTSSALTMCWSDRFPVVTRARAFAAGGYVGACQSGGARCKACLSSGAGTISTGCGVYAGPSSTGFVSTFLREGFRVLGGPTSVRPIVRLARGTLPGTLPRLSRKTKSWANPEQIEGETRRWPALSFTTNLVPRTSGSRNRSCAKQILLLHSYRSGSIFPMGWA
jgi:hypothetical protein